jgi:hypothetical protein
MLRTTLSMALLTASVLACATDGSGDEDGSGKSDTAGTNDVTLFAAEHIFFDKVMNHTTAESTVMLPTQGPFKKVTLEFKLSCPEGNACDHWDRPGALSYLDADGKPVEFARFMTPYRLGGTWNVDVTDLQPVLRDKLTMRVFINTFVGPNINTEFGKGWIVDAVLKYEPGQPEKLPIAAVPLQFGEVAYGEPTKPPKRTASVDVDGGVSSVGFYMLISGHGQGNLDNCAEFCQKTHSVQVGTAKAEQVIWRDDCHLNPVSPQFGNWKFARAGWCPGDMVHPWRGDLGEFAPASYDVTYDVEAYENTCRPDSPVCSGCSLGNGCEYNGGSHTNARWMTNGFVILYQ